MITCSKTIALVPVLLLIGCGEDSPSHDVPGGQAGVSNQPTGGTGNNTGGSAAIDNGLLAPDADEDSDGVSNAQELALGTSPFRFDSDWDGFSDADEVGEDLGHPLDADADGVIDALENPWFDSDQDGEFDPDDPTEGWQIVWGGFTPAVVRNDGQDSAFLEVHLANYTELTKVKVGRASDYVVPTWTEGIAVDGEMPLETPVELFDDGSHGDLIAGDGVFSRAGFTVQGTVNYPNALRGMTYLNALYMTEAGAENEYQLSRGNENGFGRMARGFGLGVLDPSVQTEIRDVDSSTRLAPHIINVIDAEQATTAYHMLDRHGPTNTAYASEDLLQSPAFASVRADTDFLYVFAERPTFSRAAGKHWGVANDVLGVGVETAEPIATAPKLQGLVLFDFFAECPISNETLHQWAVDLDPSFGFSGDRHWGFAGTNGVLGGFDPDTLVDNGDGTYTVADFSVAGNDFTTTPYADIELYLMGLLPAEEVEPFPVLQDGQFVDFADETVTVSASGVQMVSIQDIIDLQGERVPAFGAAQTEFRGTFAVFSSRPLTDTELTFLDHQAAAFGVQELDGGMSFYEATGGRATMTTTLP